VPDPQVRAFLYRFFGYALTGNTDEQCFVFLFGSGQNGKGTFLETIRSIWGSYAAQASINLLTRQHHERQPEELAALRGVRLVIAHETDRGTSWDEAKLKAMVSGERIRARYMFRDSFEFTPKFKIAVSGNNKPALGDVHKAMRRRILLVPFNVEIPHSEKNINLKRDLVPEYPGILYKFLIGLHEYSPHRASNPQSRR
jgi:putative DNA primase/helicase